MKILKVLIKNYQQFKHLELDFTHPETGEPLDKVCFIGRNATGKSTILAVLCDFLKDYAFFRKNSASVFLFNVKTDDRTFYYLLNGNLVCVLDAAIEQEPNWLDRMLAPRVLEETIGEKKTEFTEYVLWHTDLTLDAMQMKDNAPDLLVYCPAESKENQYLFEDVPETTLGDALQLADHLPFYHEVSEDTIKDFWKLIIYHQQVRREQFDEYAENNGAKSYDQIKEEFKLEHPDLLVDLADVWNKILEHVDLFFDYANHQKPKMATDNLKAYIKHKKTGLVPYNKLSTGIRNFIFKIGHIYSLYFNRNIERGFLLVDEPENSLFPDFLYDLMDEVYCKMIENQHTQFFVSTHHPIIATQFEPYERIILDFDEDGFVDILNNV